MAKNKQADDLFDHLRASGVRKRVAKAIADGAGSKNGKKAEALAQTALADLRSASDAIRDRVINRDSKRSDAAKKAARTRKRNAAKRSATAKKAAATRKGSKKRARSSR
jgi:hypothetical protein